MTAGRMVVDLKFSEFANLCIYFSIQVRAIPLTYYIAQILICTPTPEAQLTRLQMLRNAAVDFWSKEKTATPVLSQFTRLPGGKAGHILIRRFTVWSLAAPTCEPKYSTSASKLILKNRSHSKKILSSNLTFGWILFLCSCALSVPRGLPLGSIRPHFRDRATCPGCIPLLPSGIWDIFQHSCNPELDKQSRKWIDYLFLKPSVIHLHRSVCGSGRRAGHILIRRLMIAPVCLPKHAWARYWPQSCFPSREYEC